MSLPRLVLDWDYDTFTIEPSPAEATYYLWNAPDVDVVVIEGWPWPGGKLAPTVMRRVPGTVWAYRAERLATPDD